ncbi:AMP-binding protein [Propionibacterium australiense]|nr:AMP-binding protein [Propionibacterium australiense]SYZ32248.1 AMP-dependent synthetase/ligase [Propionibacterium australiense]VEH90589.1 Short-chain-fatty-acid--CoA ligase [Propionibacterium australiense]
MPAALRADFRARGWWGEHCLLDWWNLAVLASPDAPAVIDRNGTRFTYAEADELSSRFAGWLVGAGVRPGAVVAVQLPNWAEFLPIFIGIMKAGAVINPLSANLRSSELRHAVNTCGTTIMLMPAAFRSTDYHALGDDLLEQVAGLQKILFVRDAPDNDSSFSSAVKNTQPVAQEDWLLSHGEDLAAVLFTSGSESEPKGVMLSHNNLIASEISFSYALRLGPEDRMLMPAPVGHATGFMHGVVMPVLTRGTSLLCDSTKGPEMAEFASRYGATCGMSVPAVIDSMLCTCEELGTGLARIRFLCCGGSPVPRRLLERARSLGIRVYSVYGATESAPHTMTTFHDSDERVLSTDGRACPGTEIRIVDRLTHKPVPAGVEGEEASRGPAVFCGYMGHPELTAAAVDKAGWYYSGDLAIMDDDGYIRVTGRCKDVINRGGENISAAEVERALMCHPAVLAAAVVAMPDRVMGQRACAFLVSRDKLPKLSVADLNDYFVSRGMAKFKIPERVEYLDELPTTSSGKVSKRVLRERIEAMLEVEHSDQMPDPDQPAKLNASVLRSTPRGRPAPGAAPSPR